MFLKIEWGWVDYILIEFNLEENVRGWIKIVVSKAKACIKINGFVSKYFQISRGAVVVVIVW